LRAKGIKVRHLSFYGAPSASVPTSYQNAAYNPSTNVDLRLVNKASILSARHPQPPGQMRSASSNPNARLDSINSAQVPSRSSTQTINAHFHRATPAQIQGSGQIHEIKKGLMVGHLVDDGGKVIYFARETLTPQRAQLWQAYNDSVSNCASNLSKLISSTVDSGLKQIAFKSLEHFCPLHLQASIIKSITKNAANISTAEEKLLDLDDKLYTIEEGSSAFHPVKGYDAERHVIYASTEPVVDFALDQIQHAPNGIKSLNALDAFSQHTSHIAMCVVAEIEGKCVEHRGIFKPPLAMMNKLSCSFKSQGIPEGGLSMGLHLFGMKCASRQGAEYMSVSPVKRMGPIFCNGMDKEIRQGHIAVGEKNIQKQSLGQYIKESIQGELPIVCRLNAQTLKLWR
tara:strand:- start:100 stop:1296 length:1197 start_codon:yes stop_codon:yes gene_type:complete